MGDEVTRTARISDCGAYRYLLGRVWDPGLFKVSWVMLNPSTADGQLDDPTVRKCMGFSRRWGFGGLVIVNLFAFRATKPVVLRYADDPIGPENELFIRKAMESPTIVAWGAGIRHALSGRVHTAIATIRSSVTAAIPVWELGRTQKGHPTHPLMISYDTKRRPAVL